MQIKNSQIVNFLNGVAGIQAKRLPVKVAHAIALNIKLVEPAATIYEAERQKIAGKYAVRNESGKTDTVADEAALIELLSIEVELPIQQVTLADLEKCDAEQFDALSIQDIMALDFMTKSE